MYKLRIILLALLSSINISNAKSIDYSNLYVGIGGNVLSTGKSGDTNPLKQQVGQDRAIGATLLVGYSIRDFLDLEARFMKTVSKDNLFKQASWGVFLKPKYELFSDFSIYGLYGVGGVKITPKQATDDYSVTDISFGAGASYKVTSNLYLFTDYIDSARDNLKTFNGTKEQVDTKSVTTGLIYNF